MRLALHAAVLMCSLAGLDGCGPVDRLSSLAIRVQRASSPAALRGFDPLNPPVWVRVKVVRSTDVLDPVVYREPLWDDLPLDPDTGRRRLAVGVAPNAGGQDPYLLQLASEVEDDLNRKVVDECGVAGGLETREGQEARVTVATHLGECGILCARDADCPGSRYCLGFECQDGRDCDLDADCPAGAHCGADLRCTALCGEALPACPTGFTCCGALCAPGCGVEPEPP
ncbi:MAG TPA: hypothetical protein PK668_03860 [Myxococcota bacterium]|nr:hypothetical protein [Myxococcota bacterium]HRY91993.1 hypothetical protein [Myxococcota bacterium]HSA23275.1 hypothetical protein [Myxococcota bacterium]